MEEHGVAPPSVLAITFTIEPEPGATYPVCLKGRRSCPHASIPAKLWVKSQSPRPVRTDGCSTPANDAELARHLGVTTSRINGRLLLLRLDPHVQSMFDRGDLPLTLALVLLRVAKPVRQLTVPELEQLASLAGRDVRRVRVTCDTWGTEHCPYCGCGAHCWYHQDAGEALDLEECPHVVASPDDCGDGEW